MIIVSEGLNKWVYRQLQTNGWSMRELGRRGRLSPSFISAVLSGKKEPGPKFYQAVAKAFDMTLEAIEQLDHDGTLPHNRADEDLSKDLLQVARTLSSEDLKDVLDYALYRSRRSKDQPL